VPPDVAAWMFTGLPDLVHAGREYSEGLRQQVLSWRMGRWHAIDGPLQFEDRRPVLKAGEVETDRVGDLLGASSGLGAPSRDGERKAFECCLESRRDASEFGKGYAACFGGWAYGANSQPDFDGTRHSTSSSVIDPASQGNDIFSCTAELPARLQNVTLS
jgi:hypothetical protein